MEIRGIGKLNWRLIKYFFILLVTFVIVLNIHLSFTNNGTKPEAKEKCQQKLVLAELASYYEKLLQSKGVNLNVLEKTIEENKERTFNVFHKEVDKLHETKQDNVPIIPPTLEGQLEEKKKIAVYGDRKIQNFRLSSKESVYKGLVVDWWSDFCLRRVSWKSVWHPLFPTIPQHTTLALKTEDNDRILGGVYRRLYGYIFVKGSDASYDFRLMSRDGAEAILMDSGFDINDIHKVSDNIKYVKNSVTMHLRLTKSLMDYQDKKIQLQEMFIVGRNNVLLKGNRLYHIEILQGGKYFAKYSLQWKKRDVVGAEFVAIDQENLCHVNSKSGKILPSIMKQKYHPFVKYRMGESERLKVSYFKRRLLTSEKEIEESSHKCRSVPKDLKKISYIYQGYYEYTENVLVYPKENFNHFQTNLDETVLNDEEAVPVANKVFDKLANIYKDKLELLDVVHVQTNYNKSFQKFEDLSKTYYFVELDIKYNDDESTIYRSSHFVKPLPSGDICFLTEWRSNPSVEINLLTPLRNQLSWFKYLIKMLEELLGRTKETNVKLVVIDYNSTDGNYEEILKSSKLKHQYLNPVVQAKNSSDTKFNKVRALNYGIKHVKNDDSIVFILDLHLQLPMNIFDRIRKLTTQGRTAFNPSLLKLWCGEHEQYTDLENSEWLDYGTGMMAMYKSDWDHVGGFDEKKFANKWGGEDWEVMDRIVASGIYIIHQRMARFYHIHHSKSGMWT